MPAKPFRLKLIPFLVGCILGYGAPHAGQVAFPPNAFAAKAVRSVAEFGAKPDDVCNSNADTSCLDGAALQRAISGVIGAGQNRYLFIPKGTYYIDVPLEWKAGGVWAKGLTLIGESRDNTIIKLKNSSAGFGSKSSPKAMITTADQPNDLSQDGKGNSAFFNYIQNLTLDAGAGNPGAIGIDFIGNNNAGVKDVTIKGTSGGKAGLALTRMYQGPSYFKNLTVNGFDYGIWCDQRVGPTGAGYYATAPIGNTFEHIKLNGQQIAGVYNYRDFLYFRDLRSVNTVRAVDAQDDDWGFLEIIDADLTGGASGDAAILNAGHAHFQNVYTSGYGKAYQVAGVGNRPEIDKSARAEKSFYDYTTVPPATLFGGGISPRLPVEDMPDYFDTEMSHWQEVPPPSGGDDYAAIVGAVSNALAGGKTTLWFHPGIYRVRQTIVLNGNIRHILGTGTNLTCTVGGCEDATHPWPLIDFRGTADLRIEYMHFGYMAGNKTELFRPGMIAIRHTAPNSLSICKGGFFNTNKPFQGVAGAGKLFLEDVGQAAGWYFAPGQKVWARQFDIEGDVTGFVNDGAQVWILGLKTEIATMVGETRPKGVTRVLGGMLKETKEGGNNGNPGNTPAFINNEGDLYLSLIDNPTSPGVEYRYNILVRETRHGRVRDLLPPANQIRVPPGQSIGTSLPGYSGSRYPQFPATLGRMISAD